MQCLQEGDKVLDLGIGEVVEEEVEAGARAGVVAGAGFGDVVLADDVGLEVAGHGKDFFFGYVKIAGNFVAIVGGRDRESLEPFGDGGLTRAD